MFLLSVHLPFGSGESLPLASNSSRTLNILFHRLVLASSIAFISLPTIFDILNCPALKIYSASCCCASILNIYITAASRSLAGPVPKGHIQSEDHM